MDVDKIYRFHFHTGKLKLKDILEKSEKCNFDYITQSMLLCEECSTRRRKYNVTLNESCIVK